MPFYTVEQVGVPGLRLIEADKPASALNHVTANAFTVTKVDGRALLDAAAMCVVEVAGAPKVDDADVAKVDASTETVEEARVYNDVDPDDSKSVIDLDPDRLREDLHDPVRVNPLDDE